MSETATEQTYIDPQAGDLLRGVDLSGRDLSGRNLAGINLAGANLTGVRFFRSNLTGADLSEADLSGAEFAAADLTEANLEGINGARAGFGQANMTNVKLFRANLQGASLSQAELKGANLSCANLQQARLRESNLNSADFSEADLREADLSLADVTKSIFFNADLRQARLRRVGGFKKANWIGVDIRDINFAGAYLMRREIVDQNFIKEFRCYNKLTKLLYYPWWITCDCGRSMLRWCLWIAVQTFFFAWIYSMVGLDYGSYPTWLSPLYFSVVTLTTLGYGDVLPATPLAQMVTMCEVTIGYMMLGGLLSIFSNKLARRGD